ncbi:uncharacterized protein LOC126841026 [Adelges cooleyi]|uniref:uncharacterized protein LOC126841026 n=1 Tax=Adelges cooleyi TaxID=133065 RepID=UPI00217F64D0|nr:uncharacterized protein LOC126841026 [Adelges cooleyi]
MYLKIVILFFCVELYLLQCHCLDPTVERFVTIKNIVDNYANPDGMVVEDGRDLIINLNGVKDVIVTAAQQFGVHIDTPSLEELQQIGTRYRYTLQEVERYAAKYLDVAQLTPTMATWVSRCFRTFDQNGIFFDELKDILTLFRTEFPCSTDEYPYASEPKTSIPYKTARSEYEFTKKEATFIAIDYFFPGSF